MIIFLTWTQSFSNLANFPLSSFLAVSFLCFCFLTLWAAVPLVPLWAVLEVALCGEDVVVVPKAVVVVLVLLGADVLVTLFVFRGDPLGERFSTVDNSLRRVWKWKGWLCSLIRNACAYWCSIYFDIVNPYLLMERSIQWCTNITQAELTVRML